MVGARRGQPYGFRSESNKSLVDFAIFVKLRDAFSWQAQDAANLMVSDFAKASHNLDFLVLRDAFFVAGAGRGQPYGHFSW